MPRKIGLALGAIMLLDGIKDTIAPRLGFQLWNKYLRGRLPGAINADIREYSQLSDSALRYLSVWEVALALVVLWLASTAGDQEMDF